MGEEISRTQFAPQDFERYKQRLETETAWLKQCFDEHGFDASPAVAGFELEAWLVDSDCMPTPNNAAFLAQLNNPLASPELASFNIELNNTPRALTGHVCSAMHNELDTIWRKCREVATQLDNDIVMIGILPTVENEALNLANMSKMERYRALNREVVRMRHGRPMQLDIHGEEHLKVIHRDVMLESAATSFQIHLQITQDESVRMFNASTILSAAMVALSANSPFLFGKSLWDETRIPLFEQAVAVGGYDGAAFGPIRRVTFGDGYVRHSLFECFQDNLRHYPILLPVDIDDAVDKLSHVRLHNGTIWRWNRPLIGFNAAGKIHLRLEHRVVPAGPTIVDEVANASFFYGAVVALAQMETPPETQIKFEHARDNFYKAARLGLRAGSHWLDGRQIPLRELILRILLPLAEDGLEGLGVAKSDFRPYLEIIRERVETGCNGAHWQRAFVHKHGRDMAALTAAYLQRQHQGQPVHSWTV